MTLHPHYSLQAGTSKLDVGRWKRVDETVSDLTVIPAQSDTYMQAAHMHKDSQHYYKGRESGAFKVILERCHVSIGVNYSNHGGTYFLISLSDNAVGYPCLLII